MSPRGFGHLAVLTALVTAALVSCGRDVSTPDAGHTPQTPLPQTTVTTAPPVEPALELSVILTPGSSPHIRSVVIRSRSDLPIDLSGWLLESPGFESQGVELPVGTVITSSVSFGVYQIRARVCPSAVAAMYLCYSPFSDEDPALHPSGIVLRDVDGIEVASWSQWD